MRGPLILFRVWFAVQRAAPTCVLWVLRRVAEGLYIILARERLGLPEHETGAASWALSPLRRDGSAHRPALGDRLTHRPALGESPAQRPALGENGACEP